MYVPYVSYDNYYNKERVFNESTLLPSSDNHNRFPTNSKIAILGTQKEFSNQNLVYLSH